MIDFDRVGAQRQAGAISEQLLADLVALAKDIPPGPGTRLVERPDIVSWLDEVGVTGEAARRLRSTAHAVRAILFDKSDDANWALAWHQDRTIAVRKRVDVAGFDHWTTKGGIQHVEPPFGFIERMVTVRIHIDPVPEDNAPLLVVPGSHRLGRVDDLALERLGDPNDTLTCIAQNGDLWWYRTAIVHRSLRASGGKGRRVLQVDYSRDELPQPLAWRGVG